jgi:hypothetical protein
MIQAFMQDSIDGTKMIALVRILSALIWMSVVLGPLPAQEAKKTDSRDTYLREVKEPTLAQELVRRFQSDQDARKELIKFQVAHQLVGKAHIDKVDPKIAAEYKVAIEKVKEEDRKNLQWMKGVVGKHGWPGKSLVGVIGAQNAWLLVQHADADRDFQELCLKQMQALPPGEVEPRHLAYLTDRVLVGRGKKQKYGTQAEFRDGKAVPSPIDEEAAVDERRKVVGLEPLAEYLKTLEAVYMKHPQAEIKEQAKTR